MTPKPILKLALGFTVLAILCGTLEAMFFGGRVSDDGVVQESLFLPLAFIFAAMAVTSVVFAVLRVFLK
ncbi:hypothetical protein MWU54_17160 [Marivita sp. S6314]|uniref:hypothetical protein n=1 Tax=Marivita sp. S6314 TaxID=2926406 RepID=UPI001FF45970|nr:hypothetical protein [Marivita sp. S6314]MCK0151776.1 hypothetical protein [Marivita sp. S6314]